MTEEKIYCALNTLSDEELYKILCKNEAVALNVLAGICSEVLRRMLKEKYESLD
jgi:hypothetical protein